MLVNAALRGQRDQSRFRRVRTCIRCRAESRNKKKEKETKTKPREIPAHHSSSRISCSLLFCFPLEPPCGLGSGAKLAMGPFSLRSFFFISPIDLTRGLPSSHLAGLSETLKRKIEILSHYPNFLYSFLTRGTPALLHSVDPFTFTGLFFMLLNRLKMKFY